MDYCFRESRRIGGLRLHRVPGHISRLARGSRGVVPCRLFDDGAFTPPARRPFGKTGVESSLSQNRPIGEPPLTVPAHTSADIFGNCVAY
jgi:hypothetical protein